MIMMKVTISAVIALCTCAMIMMNVTAAVVIALCTCAQPGHRLRRMTLDKQG